MGKEALGPGHDAWQGYALGYVPHQTSIADSRTEGRRKNAVAYRTVAVASPSSVRPCTQLETSESVIRERHKLPARQDLPTRDLVAHHRRRLQLHLKSQPQR
jgi:hypothetical protein